MMEELEIVIKEEIATLKTVTPEALRLASLDLLDGQYVEVQDGVVTILEKKMTWTHTLIIKKILLVLETYVTLHALGLVMPDGARYVLVSNQNGIRRTCQPDLSFVREGRIPSDFDWDGDFYGAPDLAVEVISLGQSNRKLTQKVFRYLEAGTEEVWFINPTKKTVTQYRADDTEPHVYSGDEAITTPLFAELSLVTSALFAK
jgi:Uma2 family endonuclease